MEVTHIRVSFLREKQPAQYEKAAPFVEFSATLGEGDDPRAAARALMRGAVETVYAGIGFAVPDKAAQMLGNASVEMTLKGDRVGSGQNTPEAHGEPEEKPAKRKRRTKAEIEADKAKEAAGEDKSETPSDDTLPGFDDAEPEETVSDAELQRAATAAAKKVGAEKVKELIKEFGVARSAEIPADKRAAFVEKLEGLG